MEKRAPKNDYCFIHFVMFTITLVGVVVGHYLSFHYMWFGLPWGVNNIPSLFKDI